LLLPLHSLRVTFLPHHRVGSLHLVSLLRLVSLLLLLLATALRRRRLLNSDLLG
jgi:hypothetical protein